jgi:hypothetical protein
MLLGLCGGKAIFLGWFFSFFSFFFSSGKSARVSVCYDGQPESFEGKVLRDDGQIGISISNRAFCAASRMGNSGAAIPKGFLCISSGIP